MLKYGFSIWLARLFFVAGWVILLAGLVSSFVLAIGLSDSASTEDSAGVFFVTLIGTAAGGFFASMLTWAIAYAVLFLSDIEVNTRRRGR